MAKTAKCTKCTFKKERQQQVGGATKTFYDWDVEFDNGDKGICGTMTKDAPFQIGASCEYEIEEKSGVSGNGTAWSFNKISRPKQPFGGGQKRDDSKERIKAHAIRCASIMYTNNSMSVSEEEVKNGIPNGTNSFTKTVNWLDSTMQASLAQYGSTNVFVIMEAMNLAVECRKTLETKDMVAIYQSVLKALLDVQG